jgi:uncharacterized protein VirK/YbjX
MLNAQTAAFLNVYESANAARMMRRSIPMSEIQSRSFQPSVNVPLKVGFQSSCVTPDDDLIPGRKLDERHGFLRWMFLLVRKKHSWSPVLIAAELWRFLINIGKYREIFRLLRLEPFAEIAQDNPGFSLKYLVPDYLARGFTGTECVCCFLHHYRRIHAALPENALRQVLQGNITLYEIAEGGNRFAFTMGLPERNIDKEGELSLDLRVDGTKIFNLCFTIVPGWVLKSEAPEALLISRLQGTPGCRSQINAARKALNDYSPRSLLLAALQGIADALGVNEIEAVSAKNQKSYIKGCPAIFKNGYDGFFTKAGMVETSVGFYSSPIPIEGKPLALFKGRARLRARKRRANRQQIRAACADFLLEITG